MRFRYAGGQPIRPDWTRRTAGVVYVAMWSKHCLFTVFAAMLAVGCGKTPSNRTPDKKEAPATVPRPTVKTLAETCAISTPLERGVPGSPGHLIASARNPNGDSELASIMRTIQADLTAARPLILKGQAPPELLARHARIQCTWPTENIQRNKKYSDMAEVYLYAIEDMEGAQTPEDRKMAYGRAINACLSCHENTCPGPIGAIRKLRLPE